MVEYKNPPINELVLDVQYQDIPLSTIKLAEVRSLFIDSYPEFEEREPLNQEFENDQAGNNFTIQFNNFLPPLRRQWFKNTKSTQLFQLQQNRLIHNWRKIESDKHLLDQSYPRFKQVELEFRKYLNLFNEYVERSFGSPLILNQWELTKFNLIELEEDWLSSLYDTFSCLGENQSFEGVKGENIRYQTQNIISSNGSPFGRLYVSLESVDRPKNRKAALLRITTRGRPDDITIKCSLDKINLSNDIINSVFNGLTTSEAKKKWY